MTMQHHLSTQRSEENHRNETSQPQQLLKIGTCPPFALRKTQKQKGGGCIYAAKIASNPSITQQKVLKD